MEAILRAAAELFAREGYAGTTTNRVAERAGVSIGSLYQYFPDKEALLAALMGRHLEAVEALVGPALERLADPGVPLESAIRGLVEGLLRLHTADPVLTAAVGVEAPPGTRRAAAHRKRDRETVARVEALLAGRPDVRAGDRGVMAGLLAVVVEAATRWMAHERPAGVDPRVVVEETVRLVCRYLSA